MLEEKNYLVIDVTVNVNIKIFSLLSSFFKETVKKWTLPQWGVTFHTFVLTKMGSTQETEEERVSRSPIPCIRKNLNISMRSIMSDSADVFDVAYGNVTWSWSGKMAHIWHLSSESAGERCQIWYISPGYVEICVRYDIYLQDFRGIYVKNERNILEIWGDMY